MISSLITFLVGVVTGAAGKYFADKYTDQRRAKENCANMRNVFCSIAGTMPDLIKEIQDDLSSPDSSIIREFIIRQNKNIGYMSGGKKYFSYYEDQHKNLLEKATLLENNNLIDKVSYKDIPKYRMTEEFVNMVINAKIKNGKVKL